MLHVLSRKIGVETADASAYIAIANGLPTLQPFADRWLIPRVAGWISSGAAIDLVSAFQLVKLCALVTFLWFANGILEHLGTQRYASFFVLLASPFARNLYELTYIPDLEAVALLAGAVYSLLIGRFVPYLSLLFLAILARETALVAAAIIGAAAVARGEASWAIGTTVVGLAAFVTKGAFRGDTLGNIHEMNAVLYMVLKIPVNAIANWVGIRFYTPTGLTCEPRWFSVAIPAEVFGNLKGGIQWIGLCYPDIEWVTRTLVLSLAPFGVGMGVAFVAILRGQAARGLDAERRGAGLASAVGGALWVLGTMSGTWIDRLVAAGWMLPCLWLAETLSNPKISAVRKWSICAAHALAGYGLFELMDERLIGGAIWYVGCGLVVITQFVAGMAATLHEVREK